MRKPIVGRVLLVVVAAVSRAPLDEFGWPNAAVISGVLGLFLLAQCLAADMNRIESGVLAAVLAGSILTAAFEFSRRTDLTYLQAFLGTCFWVSIAWSLLWIIPLALDVWDRRKRT